MRPYRLGKRQVSVDRTDARILEAAREMVASGTPPSVGAIAAKAGVSRITVYNRFGSKPSLLAALRPQEPMPQTQSGTPRDRLREYLLQKCSGWARDPALYRNLPSANRPDDIPRTLAERLATSDELRPGCSIKEAADVIAALTSFAMFDRLHGDGRRPATAVAEILMRLASGILPYHP